VRLRWPLAALGLLVWVAPVAASNAAVGLGEASARAVTVPTWLYLLSGGAVVGVSALLAGVVTDRRLLAQVHGWGPQGDLPAVLWRLRPLGPFVGLGLAAVVLSQGWMGPQLALVNPAVAIAFVGVRALVPIIAMTVGDVWRWLDPIQLVGRGGPAPAGDRWPAVGVYALAVWLETTAGVTDSPRRLAVAVAGYLLAGVVVTRVWGYPVWHHRVDPIAAVSALFARVAPLRIDDGGLRLRLPGAGTVANVPRDDADAPLRTGELALVLFMVFELTFSGFINSAPGTEAIGAAVGWGLPPLAVYLGLFIGGAVLTGGAYATAAVVAHRRIRTTYTPEMLALVFGPTLLAIAAGYHLAHYLLFAVTASPLLVAALSAPLTPLTNPIVLAAPAWSQAVPAVTVLAGHVIAVGAAHISGFTAFPLRRTAIAVQLPFVAVMVGYTMLSLWLVTVPTAAAVFV
jgi:hypothetical protein